MRDIWYADNRDLVKWAILYHLTDSFKVDRIIQVAFYRKSEFEQIEIDGQKKDMPKEVISHFRNINNVCRMKFKAPIKVFNQVFKNNDRPGYLRDVSKYLSQYQKEKLIVFLDPDTGLWPETKYSDKHVLEEEAKKIFGALKPGDVFVFYQHQTNRRGEEWIGPKKNQLAKAIGLSVDMVKLADGPKIASDAAVFYVQKK